MTDALEALRALPDAQKARMRRLIRRRMGECRQWLLRALQEDARAMFSAYLAESERALALVNDDARR